MSRILQSLYKFSLLFGIISEDSEDKSMISYSSLVTIAKLFRTTKLV